MDKIKTQWPRAGALVSSALCMGVLVCFPGAAAPLALVLLWGLFLLGCAAGRGERTLLLPLLGAAALSVGQVSVGHSAYPLPQPAQGVFGGLWVAVLALAALVLYLLLHRDRTFWRQFGAFALLNAAILGVAALVSWVRSGRLSGQLAQLAEQVRAGAVGGLLHGAALWLALVCALQSAWALAHSVARAQKDIQALSLRNRLILENYDVLQQKLRESAALRHEFSHRLVAMESLLNAEDWDGLRRCMATWQTENTSATQFNFTQNMAVNIILQDAAARALAAEVKFRASAIVPPELPVTDEDLCTLLMNLLDNALEGAARTPAGAQKTIQFRANASDGILLVKCDNTFDGRVATDSQGQLQTTKAGPESHGFGLAQMRTVAEKYGGALAVSYTPTHFTVQISMRLTKKP